jgi:predicted Zn-dependent protease
VALLGGKNHEKADPAAAMAIEPSPGVARCVAVTEAVMGNDAAASRIIDELARNRPKDTWVQSVWAPAVHAVIEMNHGNGAKALELLKIATPYYKASGALMALHAQAYLLSNQPLEAEKILQAVLGMQHDVFQDPTVWLAQLYLARAYVMEGDKAKARAAYQDFLASWKNADPDLPLLAEAKAEYAKLE